MTVNLTAYRAARAWFPYPARPTDAGRFARETPVPLLFAWADAPACYGKGLPVGEYTTADGFTVRATVSYDQTYNPFDDTDCYGMWGSHQYASNGVKAVKRDKHRRERHSYEYWYPGDGQDYDSLYREARTKGYARGPASDYARERAQYFYLRAEEVALSAGYTVRVTVRKARVELASASCGGIDALDLEYLDSTARDLLFEAEEQARAALAALCGCGGAQ